jgi:hypothetical protein
MDFSGRRSRCLELMVDRAYDGLADRHGTSPSRQDLALVQTMWGVPLSEGSSLSLCLSLAVYAGKCVSTAEPSFDSHTVSVEKKISSSSPPAAAGGAQTVNNALIIQITVEFTVF